jgi:predicted enzyme related to lactoylglutathione lyase
MKKTDIVYTIVGIGIGFLFSFGANNESTVDETKNDFQENNAPRVTGIGGIFFFSDNPTKTKEWYNKHLGLVTNEWGSTFEFRNANNPNQINYLQWSPFKTGNDYFQPSENEFMINYRVTNIEKLVTELKKNGVTVLDTIENYDYGKFVHILDPEGRKIELWEPVDSELTKIGSPTTK